MTITDIVALASPIVPATLVTLVLRSHWWRGAIAPLQFSAFICEAVLAIAARMAAAQIAVGVSFAIGVVGLVAVVFREEWSAHRAATAVFRWEEFESDFRSHVANRPPGPDGSLASR
jgi:hypothetical protein